MPDAENTTPIKVAGLAICALLGACSGLGMGGESARRASFESLLQEQENPAAATRQSYRNARACGGSRFRSAFRAPWPLLYGDANAAMLGGRHLVALGDTAASIDCPDDARTVYYYVLRTFPDPTYTELRDRAVAGLNSLGR